MHAFWGAGRPGEWAVRYDIELTMAHSPAGTQPPKACLSIAVSHVRTCAHSRARRAQRAGPPGFVAVGRLLANQVELRLCEDAEQVGLDKPLQLDADRKPACAAMHSKNGSRLLAASACEREGGRERRRRLVAQASRSEGRRHRVRCELHRGCCRLNATLTVACCPSSVGRCTITMACQDCWHLAARAAGPTACSGGTRPSR